MSKRILSHEEIKEMLENRNHFLAELYEDYIPYIPCEGIFWVINEQLVAFTEQADTSGKLSTTLEHRRIWNEILLNYRLENGCTVRYDYFHRGRVMVNPKYRNETFDHYDVYIYIDDCINNPEILNDIIHEFRLNRNCDIKYIGSEGGVESNHYRCHNCKNKEEN
jgi:hypothetical protein